MCGFSGIISQKPFGISLVSDSLKSIKHRGPDDTLVFDGESRCFYALDMSSPHSLSRYPILPDNQQSSVVFGFNRLSIVDLSPSAMQPFYDPDQQILFLLNGEIYNYNQLKADYLPSVSFHSNSDSEVAFRLYLLLGNAFIEHLQGMFSIVVYDFKNQTLRAWRDRFGMKPFYYSFLNRTFIFSSEMKGIFAIQRVERQLNYTGIAYSMYLGTCPAPLTIYKNILSLQAAHYLEFSFVGQTISIQPYWNLNYNPSGEPISSDEFNRDMKDLACLHTTGDVKKALMLSGGTDSGLLAKFLSEQDASLQAINIYAEEHETDEREYALSNAGNAGIELTCIEIPGNPSIEQIEHYLLSEEEPNASPEPAYFLSEEAKKMNYPVLYNALGLDELFGGYKYYQTANKLDRWLKLLRYMPLQGSSPFISKLKDLKRFGTPAMPFITRQLFSWNEILELLEKNLSHEPIHPVAFLLDQANAHYPSFDKMPVLKKISWLDFHYYISSHHTFRTDQPSMKHAVEMRFPYLDHLFIQKYFNDNSTFNDIRKTLKPRLKEYASTHLSNMVLKMPKKGFSMPTERWIQSMDTSTHFSNAAKTWYWLCLDRIRKSADLSSR